MQGRTFPRGPVCFLMLLLPGCAATSGAGAPAPLTGWPACFELSWDREPVVSEADAAAPIRLVLDSGPVDLRLSVTHVPHIDLGNAWLQDRDGWRVTSTTVFWIASKDGAQHDQDSLAVHALGRWGFSGVVRGSRLIGRAWGAQWGSRPDTIRARGDSLVLTVVGTVGMSGRRVACVASPMRRRSDEATS